MSQYDFRRIILVAGHSPNDPGAVNGIYKEADETVKIVNQVEQLLNKVGFLNIKVPHDLDFIESTTWINKNYRDEDLVIEVHRDSSANVDFNESSTRLGVYGVGGSNYSMDLASTLAGIFKRKSRNKNCWARPDSVMGGLYLIRNTNPTALLVEMGFMQGRNDDEHINWLATILFESIVELTGLQTPETNKPNSMPTIRNVEQELSYINYFYKERRGIIAYNYKNKNIDYILDELKWAGENNDILVKDMQKIKSINELPQKQVEIAHNVGVPITIPESIEDTLKTQDNSLNKFSFHKFMIGLAKSGQLQIILSIIATSGTGYLAKLGLNVTNDEVLTIMATIFTLFGVNISIATNNNTKK